jgi:hypothetical protein
MILSIKSRVREQVVRVAALIDAVLSRMAEAAPLDQR